MTTAMTDQQARDLIVSAVDETLIVEAAAGTGIAGLLGLLLMTAGLPLAAIRRLRLRRGEAIRAAALAGAGVYVLDAAISAGWDGGLVAGLISIYGLSLAMFAGIGLRRSPEPPPPSPRPGRRRRPATRTSRPTRLGRSTSSAPTRRGTAAASPSGSSTPASTSTCSRWTAA